MKNYGQEIENLRKIWNMPQIDNESMIKRMQFEIKEEIHKPYNEMDCELIDEYVKMLLYIQGQDEEVDVNPEEELRKAYKRANSKTPWRRKVLLRFRNIFKF